MEDNIIDYSDVTKSLKWFAFYAVVIIFLVLMLKLFRII